MTLTLEQAIARVPLWTGATDLRATPLGGGITNRNYRIDVGGESFVLRIGGEKTELLGIDRRNEYAANAVAAAIGVAPEPVYFIEPEGYLVTRFITARPIPRDEMTRPENILRVADALRRVHGLPAIPGVFSPFRTIESYAATARDCGVAFPDDIEWLVQCLRDIEAALSRDPFTGCPCHNDLLNENFLDDGRLRILDWEYAGMGDPAFDLANLAVHHGFTDDQERLLLERYAAASPEGNAHSEGGGAFLRSGTCSPRRFARHKLLKIVSDGREAMWGMVQIGISKLDFDFRGYADKHFQRMAGMIQDPRYVDWLGAVQE